MSFETKTKPSIINCHTHIFTGDHVPPFIAKTFLYFPLFYLLNLSFIVRFFRWWYNGPDKIKYTRWYKRLSDFKNSINVFLNRFGILKSIVALFLTLQVIFILFDWISTIFLPEESKYLEWFRNSRIWLMDYYILIPISGNFLKIVMIVFVLLFVKWGRNLIFFIFNKFWSFFRMLPGPQTKEMFMRYLNIGRYAFHDKQSTILGKLRNQYPEGTGFVILPMDMEYMKMGKVKKSYRAQMEELKKLKKDKDYTDIIFPFVFVDPRRIINEQDYFQYDIGADGSVILKDCFIKEYIEKNNFSGFKIYPALGYYPFDKQLLPLWKYAADNKLPVLTHCIRGTIFFRGKKNKEWNRHPIFEQAMGKKKVKQRDGTVKEVSTFESLLLPEMKNVDFSYNFTHPLNYLCILEERLLRKVVATADYKVQELFGYINPQTVLKHNLHHLKLCFGHFGGDDEWLRFFEKDRDNFSSQLVRRMGWGIDFLTDDEGRETKGKPEQIWKDADWYSIICSLMQQYPNVYADISYILHNDTGCLPLLKHTLQTQHEQLRKRVLYGSDFYVVRNHKSDKQMLADMIGGLSEEEFDLIARENPRNFLYNKLHGELEI